MQRAIPIPPQSVVMLGDGHIAAGDWPGLFPDLRIVERGIDGDTARDVRHRLDEVVEAQPASVALLAGGADLTARRARADTVHDLAQIIDRLQIGSPDTHVIVHTLPPRGDRYRQAVEPLNHDIARVANDREAIVVDLYAELSDAAGRLRRDLTSDGTNLLGPAYLVWQGLLAPHLGS